MKRLLFILAIQIIYVTHCSEAFAKPPKITKQKAEAGNSYLFKTLSKWMLIEYSKGLVSDVTKLEDSKKEEIMYAYTEGTAAILLYEFASGLGPDTRYFYNDHPFTQALRNGPGMRWILNAYLSQYACTPDSTGFLPENNMSNLRYQFSPIFSPFSTKVWKFSIQQHFQTLSNKNISQFVLGSFNVEIIALDSTRLSVHLWNEMSKKSLFLGIGNKNQRPLYLGTTTQHVYLEYSLEELRCMFSTMNY